MSGNNLTNEAIYIRSNASTNGLTTLLVGVVLALIGTAIIQLLPQTFFLLGILFLSGCIIALVMGFYKLNEPKHSLEITKSHITYHHRKGQWKIPWQNIQRIDVPRVSKGLEYLDLEMIGFRLKQSEQFLQDISPRLTTHLLMEQRPLVTKIIQSGCESGQCYGDDLIEDTKYKTDSGEMITGVNAMFAHRMRRLQSGLGYDIYLSVNELDRGANEFVTLLRECHEVVMRQQA